MPRAAVGANGFVCSLGRVAHAGLRGLRPVHAGVRVRVCRSAGSESTSAGIAIRTVTIEPGDASVEDEIAMGVLRQPADRMLTTLERLRQSKGVSSASLNN